jgi:tetratricopeptide (TPR) repeat protein
LESERRNYLKIYQLVAMMLLWISLPASAGEGPARLPSGAQAHFDLGVRLGEKRKFGEAEKEFRMAIRLKPGWAEAYCRLGNALAGQKKFPEAEKEFRKAIRLKPAYEPSYYNLACCYALWGKKGEAIKSLRTLADKGFYNWPLMVDDTDLDSLRDEPGFKEVDKIVQKRWEEREKAKKGPK